MHASYIFSTSIVLAPPTTGAAFLTYAWAFAIALWGIVAAVALANRGHLAPYPPAPGHRRASSG